MSMPPNYPNSRHLKTASERIPVRFRTQVRHFLTVLDRLNTDFEVHCTLFQSGELQPFTLIYTETGEETRKNPKAVVPASVVVTASATDAPVSERGALDHTEQRPDPVVDTPIPLAEPDATLLPPDPCPFSNQNIFSQETGDAGEAGSLTDSAPILNAAQLARADTPQQPDGETTAATVSPLQPTSSLTPTRRPPTLTEILEGMSAGHSGLGHRTATPSLQTQTHAALPVHSPVEPISAGFAAVLDEDECLPTSPPVETVEAALELPLTADSLPPLTETSPHPNPLPAHQSVEPVSSRFEAAATPCQSTFDPANDTARQDQVWANLATLKAGLETVAAGLHQADTANQDTQDSLSALETPVPEPDVTPNSEAQRESAFASQVQHPPLIDRPNSGEESASATEGVMTPALQPGATVLEHQTAPLLLIEGAADLTTGQGDTALPLVAVESAVLEVETPSEPLAASTLPTAVPLVLGLQDLPVLGQVGSRPDPLTTPLQGGRSVTSTPASAAGELPSGESTGEGTALVLSPPTPLPALQPPAPALENELTESTVQSAAESMRQPPLLIAATDPLPIVLESESTASAVQGLAAAVMAPTSALPLPITPPTPLPDQSTDHTLSAATSLTTLSQLPSPSESSAIATAGEGSGSGLPSPSADADERADESLTALVSRPSPSESSAIAAAGEQSGVVLTSPSAADQSVTPTRLTAAAALFLPAEKGLNGSASSPVALPSPSVALVGEPVIKGSPNAPTLPTSDSVLLPAEDVINDSTDQSGLSSDSASLPPEQGSEQALETGSESPSTPLEVSAERSGVPVSDGLEGTFGQPLQAVIDGTIGDDTDLTLQPAEPVTLPAEAGVVRGTETHLETTLDELNNTGLAVRREDCNSTSVPTDEALTGHCSGLSVLTAGASIEEDNSTFVLTEAAATGASHSAIVPSHAAPTEDDRSTAVLVSEPFEQGLNSDSAPLLTPTTPTESGPLPDDPKLPPDTPSCSAERSPTDPTAAALSTPPGVGQQADHPIAETAASEPLDPLTVEPSAPLVPAPEGLEAVSHMAVEPPDQGFAEDLFVVWRRLALTQSPTVWGVVVSLEDLFTQGFSAWFAPRFIGRLADAEGMTVTWGCTVQLVNETDTLYRQHERYQVSGKDVTGVTFQNPNARITLLEPSHSVSSLKPFAQPAPLPTFQAEPLESETDSAEAGLVTVSAPNQVAVPPQWTEPPLPSATPQPSISPQTSTSSLPETEDEAPTPPKPGSLWRAGLRLLLGR